MLIHNGLILRQPTTVFFSPQYGSKELGLSGSFSIRHRSYFQKKKLTNVSYGFGVESFHFKPDQRYYRFNPQISAMFLPEGLASNKRSIVELELVSLHQEDQNKKLLDGTFNSSLSYAYTNSNSSSSRGFGAALQMGDSFKSFLSLIGIENTTAKGNNTLFDFLLDYFSIKTKVEILILESQESMIIPLRITSWGVPKQVVFLVNNMY